MTLTLEAQITDRKKEATEKNIGGKADLIAKTLGKLRESSHVWGGGGLSGECVSRVKHYVARGRGIVVESHSCRHDDDSGNDSISIKTRGLLMSKLVYYSSEKKIECYMPGTWINKLDILYKDALKQLERREMLEKERKTQEKNKSDAELKREYDL